MADLEIIKTQAKLVASEAYNDGFGCDPWGAVIEALAAARSSTTCEQCEGEGRVAVDFGIEARGHPRIEPCPSCDGSGTVPGGPLLLDLVAEQVGWVIREPWKDDAIYPEPSDTSGWTTKGVVQVPVYVAREST